MVRLLRTAIVLTLLLTLSISGVFAFWQYSDSPPLSLDIHFLTSLFEYKEFKGIYIKSVSVVSSSSASVGENAFTTPTLHTSTVTPGKSGGSVTYKITVHNNTDITYWYSGVTPILDHHDSSLVGTNNGITLTTKDHQNDSTATFNRDDWVPPQTERDFYVTYTYGANAQGTRSTKVNFKFDIRLDGVHDEFLALLNYSKPGEGYYVMIDELNQLYAEDGTLSITTESHPELFAQFFSDLMVNIDGEEKQASVVIRRENLDKDSSTGDNYSGNSPNGCEYTLYITVDSKIPGQRTTVYAIAYSKGASGMGSQWYQVGELYEGTAPVKADGSIDYNNWIATSKTYEIADGIYYKVGAPNGDQYDIMKTMEQLISAVDQDIFNDIDNTKIFKKVYDILRKHPNSTDPAVLGLRQAFEDAAIFYRNLNNGQEFKVVRDKYTRAEIIYALKNIQKALDYYYQTVE